MTSLTIALIASVSTFGSGMLGMFVRDRLPGHHLSAESKDTVKLLMGLVASLSALVLGLLTASAKAEFDTQSNELQQSAAKIIELDRSLAGYGAEAQPVRAALQQRLVHRLDLTWPEESTATEHASARLDDSQATQNSEGLLAAINALTPANDAQREWRSQALQLGRDVLAMRWLMMTQASVALPGPFLVVLLFWLSLLFGSFGLFAPRNLTVIVVLFLSSLAVSGSLFLIIEMSRPFEGLIKVSSAPIRYALSQLGK